ncbi:unnamed protein product [Sphenostylis stenocarpa]|uniref:Uncharacterized protein n=1 Tax=Sphenostylis stenocarpa TaxID=92480 RepID=A0AA86SD41_9FABA|nr:unnamed protein product [Sphenostylis stenocarpa]
MVKESKVEVHSSQVVEDSVLKVQKLGLKKVLYRFGSEEFSFFVTAPAPAAAAPVVGAAIDDGAGAAVFGVTIQTSDRTVLLVSTRHHCTTKIASIVVSMHN